MCYAARMRNNLIQVLLLGLFLLVPASGQEAKQAAEPQGFTGFSKVVEQIEEQRSREAKAASSNEVVQLQQRWRELVENTKTGRLPADAAAKQWLDLLDMHLRLTREAPQEHWNAWIGEHHHYQLVYDLPDPAAWPQIADGLRKRAQDSEFAAEKSRALLGLLPHFLNADAGGLNRAWQAHLTKQARPQAENLSQIYDERDMMELNDAIRQFLPFASSTNATDTVAAPAEADVNVKVEAFIRRLDNYEAVSKNYEKESVWTREAVSFEPVVPPLVELLGEKEAAALLRRMFELGIEPSWRDLEDRPTRELAVSMILAEPDLAPGPIWSFIDLERGPQLAALFADRFAARVEEAERKGNFHWQQAQVVLAARKAIDGAAEEAARDLLRFKLLHDDISSHRTKLFDTLRKANEHEALFELCRHLVPEAPTPGELWERLFELGERLDRSDEVHRLARKALGEDQPLALRVQLLESLAAANVAGGQMEQGLEDYRPLLTARRKLCETADPKGSMGWEYSDAQAAFKELRRLGATLVDLGKKQDQADLVTLGREAKFCAAWPRPSG